MSMVVELFSLFITEVLGYSLRIEDPTFYNMFERPEVCYSEGRVSTEGNTVPCTRTKIEIVVLLVR